MGLAHISHKTIVRKSNLYKFADVTRVARAHLDHGKLGLRIDFQQGKRHSDIVVQIAFRCCHIVFC